VASPGRRELLVSKTWIQVAVLVFLVGFFILGLLAYRTYVAGPPVPDRVLDARGGVLYSGKDVSKGQQVFLHNVPRAMFIFLPLLAGLMMLMYWRPRHYYVEHLLLFVHNHAFVFLVAGMALLLGRLVPRLPGLNFLIFLYFAWYMYRSMRVVYQQGRLLTVSKLLLLASFYLLFASLLAAITSVYSAFTL